jgi:hypothetical protein
MNRHTPMSKADDVRETPPSLYDPLDEKYQFTLDACATVTNAKTACFYTERGYWCKGLFPIEPDGATKMRDENGLTGAWEGRVWCNPPFSEIPAWVTKAWKECRRSALQADSLPNRAHPMPSSIELIWMLVPATRTEQPWWQKLIKPFRDGKGVLVPGYRLDTDELPGRTHFLENGGPIYRKNKDGSLWIDPRTGEPVRSSPKFGCVGLIWTKEKPNNA